jgi:alpha-beta hydrolase superfamily lysophospholipase
MPAEEPQMLLVGEGERQRRIAYRHLPPSQPDGAGVLWLIGLKSDMESTKATALAAWAQARGLGCTRFDYSGHGRSQGRFEDATVGDWIEEAAAVLREVTSGPQVLVGSSTGAHVALALLRDLMARAPRAAERIRGLVLIAPAWDVTELIWRELPDFARAEIEQKGVWVRPSAYDPNGYPITRRFIEEGRRHLLSDAAFDPGRPVLVLQGMQDKDVPPAHARALASVLRGGWVRITEVPDGDHRLSRDEDIERLLRLIDLIVQSQAV